MVSREVRRIGLRNGSMDIGAAGSGGEDGVAILRFSIVGCGQLFG